MEDINITPKGIIQLLTKIDQSKASGPEKHKPRILKELAKEISSILSLIFQKSLDIGAVPSDWGTAHASPIYKKGSKYNPENYRSISLTCICCKLLDHIRYSCELTREPC